MNKKSIERSRSQVIPHWSVKGFLEEWPSTTPETKRRSWEERAITEIKESQQQTLDRIPKADRNAALRALVGLDPLGEEDPIPFCQALKEYGPILLLDPLVLECLRLMWSYAPSIPEWKEHLTQIGAALAYVGGGQRQKQGRLRTATQQLEVRRLIIQRSKAKKRGLKKFDNYNQMYGDVDKAAKHTLMDFDESPRMKNPFLKKLAREDLGKALLGKPNKR